MEKKLSLKVIWFSYAIFMAGWICKVFLVDMSSFNDYVKMVINLVVRIVWWLGFSVFFIKRYDADININLKEMFTKRINFKILGPFVLFACVFHIIANFILYGSFKLKLEMNLVDFIVTVLTVGIFEEIVFRGWFLNAFSKFMSERMANLLAGLLFVSIHFPGWIHSGMSITTILVTGVSILPLGLIFGWGFRKNRSIWQAAIMHSFWDLWEFIM